jgi:5-methylcytosine-specific restriction protein A
MLDYFKIILKSYLDNKKTRLANNHIAGVIRNTIPKHIDLIVNKDRRYEKYIIKGSAGVGKWASIPWVAIFDPRITTSAQEGYFPVYLFKDDMSGFYLSLIQGFTKIVQLDKVDAMEFLKRRAADFRAQIQTVPKDFGEGKIILTSGNSAVTHLSVYYTASNIISKYYSKSNLPSENNFNNDLLELLKVYELLQKKVGLKI